MPAATGARRESRPVHGLLLLDKPAGLTSNRALQVAKRLLGARKAGHTGSLDPAATGMLPLCFGEATKVCAYLLNSDKTYRFVARLGEATDTGDADGEITARADIPDLDRDGWAAILRQFEGEISQVPPMYSALKRDGKRLYELARRGETVDREARQVTIHDLELLEIRGARLVGRVSCSKGTYIRTLVEDIAKAAGTVAHVASLHREAVGDFRPEDMLDLSGAEAAAESGGPEALRQQLLPADSALKAWPQCSIAVADIERFCGGQSVSAGEIGEGMVRVYGPGAEFLGIGELTKAGQVAPKRVFKQAGDAGR